ncbi:hypothetical protein AtNW77_Chr1g0024511 [Arabidopsis thaliana]|uniref:Plant thionin family protein n=3 Tax=Arabidopsis TaxID=3701 RepID=A0A654EDV5_ARATH|nr:hypothetical protein ISN45_At01g022110 [Arabidopsis thaliana x Arabidopsis arenosa]KAG7655122.1 hypothetical protein ISN44_As01g022230 [Arabidopsis suecica]VYS46828.1 unnamed protein product [Arabidopsis thaliana]
MTTQTCNVFMFVAILTMMFSAHIAQSNSLIMCVKHCAHNRCLKAAKNFTPEICDETCKKICNNQLFGGEKFIVPPPKGSSHFCRWLPQFC